MMQRINGFLKTQTRHYSASRTARENFTARVMLIGMPGVGKGTYAGGSAKLLDVPHFSAGDMIRDEIRQETEVGKSLVKYTTQGKLAPDELILNIVISKLKEYVEQSGNKGFILDGFPRTQHQAEIFHDTPYHPTHVINLEQRLDLIVRKISGRRICKSCGEGYNVEYIKEEGLDMPPILPKVDGVCDRCGAKHSLVQRDDDKESVVRSRMVSYSEQTAPLLNYYDNMGILQHFKVNGGVKDLLPGFVEKLRNL